MVQPKNLISLEELYKQAEEIFAFLKEEVSTDDIEVAIQRGHELAAFMANTGKMLADARYHKDKAMRESVIFQLKDSKRSNLPASVLNELIKSEVKDYSYLVNWIEQLDKEVKYHLEWLRSVVSKEKAQMYLQHQTNSY